jgi:hypothetical protein
MTVRCQNMKWRETCSTACVSDVDYDDEPLTNSLTSTAIKEGEGRGCTGNDEWIRCAVCGAVRASKKLQAAFSQKEGSVLK